MSTLIHHHRFQGASIREHRMIFQVPRNSESSPATPEGQADTPRQPETAARNPGQIVDKNMQQQINTATKASAALTERVAGLQNAITRPGALVLCNDINRAYQEALRVFLQLPTNPSYALSQQRLNEELGTPAFVAFKRDWAERANVTYASRLQPLGININPHLDNHWSIGLNMVSTGYEQPTTEEGARLMADEQEYNQGLAAIRSVQEMQQYRRDFCTRKNELLASIDAPFRYIVGPWGNGRNPQYFVEFRRRDGTVSPLRERGQQQLPASPALQSPLQTQPASQAPAPLQYPLRRQAEEQDPPTTSDAGNGGRVRMADRIFGTPGVPEEPLTGLTQNVESARQGQFVSAPIENGTATSERVRESPEVINVRFLAAFAEAINEGQRGVVPFGTHVAMRPPVNDGTPRQMQSEQWDNTWQSPFGALFNPISRALAAFPEGRRDFVTVTTDYANTQCRAYASAICNFLNRNWDEGNLTGIQVANNGRLEEHGPGDSWDDLLISNFRERLQTDPRSVLQEFAQQRFESQPSAWSELSQRTIPRIAAALQRNMARIRNGQPNV